MRNNNIDHKHSVTFLVVALLVVCCGTLFYVRAQESEASPLEKYIAYQGTDNARISLHTEINKAENPLDTLKAIRREIKTQLGANAEDMRQNVRSAMGSLLDLSWGDAITALEDQIEDTMDGIALLSALDTANNSIKTYIENKIDLAIYQRPDSGYPVMGITKVPTRIGVLACTSTG